MAGAAFDWVQFLLQTLAEVERPFAAILNACGCREGWLQGELYWRAQPRSLRVNEYPLGRRAKADLWSDQDPRMIAEIKIIGADYYSKMRHCLDDDAVRLRAVVDPGLDRLLLLVIPDSVKRGVLGRHLAEACYGPECFERRFTGFRARIWRIPPASAEPSASTEREHA